MEDIQCDHISVPMFFSLYTLYFRSLPTSCMPLSARDLVVNKAMANWPQMVNLISKGFQLEEEDTKEKYCIFDV